MGETNNISKGESEGKNGSEPLTHLYTLDYYYKIVKFVLVILFVVALGLFIFNQFLAFRYKSLLLAAPCDVCKSFNQNQSTCINECFTVKKKLYPNGFGSWRDDFGKCYDSNGIEIKCLGVNGTQENNTFVPFVFK